MRSDGFWELADAGYVSYRRAGAYKHEIIGHKYVGRAIVSDLEVRVEEKAVGTVLALARAATGAELRVQKADSPATDFDLVSQHLMREFVSAAGAYVANRRSPRYEYRPAGGPVLAGSVDLPRTLILNMSGKVGQFAYTEGRVVRDEPLDRVVLAGLHELDRAAPALQLGREIVYDARWLAGALDEVRDATFFATTRDQFLDAADRVERDLDTSNQDADLARLAAVTLLHRGFEPDLPAQGVVPRAWFIDLEALFEQAVRETMRTLLGQYQVDRGQAFHRWMFTGGTDTSKTNPDVVVHQGSIALGVGDVKYKTLKVALGEQADEEDPMLSSKKKEGRPDLYQALIHAASLAAPLAFLVYVSDDDYVSRYLGESATGCQTWTVQVRATELSEDLTQFFREIGLLS